MHAKGSVFLIHGTTVQGTIALDREDFGGLVQVQGTIASVRTVRESKYY
jgi:hypothetical protein